MYDVPIWPTETPEWSLEYKALLLEGAINKPGDVSVDELEKRSELFPITFPVDTARCKVLKNKFPKGILERNINSVYPILSEDALLFYICFILYKRKYGSEDECNLYAHMSILEFIDRLLLKRAVVFVGKRDRYLLLNGEEGIGIEALSLEEGLSYDEIKLSAFLSISSYSQFINDGNRHNCGVPKVEGIEREGIVVGLIGPRLEKPNVMEYQEMVINKEQNKAGNGYGVQLSPTMHSFFAECYAEPPYKYYEIANLMKKEPNRFMEIKPEIYFDKKVYCKRLALSFDTLLHEANYRAKEKNTTAFVHVVGIGLGVWRLSIRQHSLFLDTFVKRIQMLANSLHSVSDVEFAFFGEYRVSEHVIVGNLIPIEGHSKGGIKIHFTQRPPHTQFTHNDKGKLLVVSYAWDGNALPGNEFWHGSLSSSGDPAQACSSQVAEIHNPHINPQVCSANLRIATRTGIVPFTTFRKSLANNNDSLDC